jgi:phosphoglycolate phosphatase
MTFKAIIFDLDGTLLDSLEGIAAAMNRLLERLGFPVHPLESYKYFVGTGINTLVRDALPEGWSDRFSSPADSDAALERLVKEYREIYEQTWRSLSKPYDGVPGLLDWLTRENIKMSILSNKSDDFTCRMVSELLPGWRFETVLGSRPGVPIKPDPFAALEIAGKMNIDPAGILFIGDSGVDMQTGVNAGMHPVGVLWGFRGEEELRQSGARRLIKHPHELQGIIEG